jgi:competence protein ComEC
VSAILIGDRTGLPDDVRERLQSAGVYHVLAISGGNIAILAGLIFVATRCLGMSPRLSTVATAVFLLVYAQVVVAGPSVFRAVVMALLYLVSRFIDQRTPPWQAVAVAAAVSVGLEPLDVADAGFVLTFAATGALLAVVPLVTAFPTRHPLARWVAGAVLASLATEAVLLPISATAFGRVTFVGVLLNMAAIPLMTVVQVAGFALCLGALSPAAGEWAGWIAHLAAFGLVESARIADWLPMLAPHVPAPPPVLLAAYYLAGAAAMFLRGALRYFGVATTLVVALLIVTGAWLRPRAGVGSDLELTMFDVGQGEAMYVSWPGGDSTVIDSGGIPFGSGSFDVGDRVLRPALWAQGVRRIDTMLLTHGDPDHVGGVSALFESFAPRVFLEGIMVPGDRKLQELRESAVRGGALVRELRAGDTWSRGGARVRVLSPDPPDWERRRVRNDDSVVLEVRYGDVAILLTGDIGADVERAILPRLSNAPVRVLKVGHHGSRTSTSEALIDAWRPHVALISCGRGNRFGHPAADIITRLERAGVETYRTDLHGAITLRTDGRSVAVTTFVP